MPSLPPILVSVVTPARGDTRLRSLPPTLHLGGAVCLPPGYPSDKRRGTVSYMVGRRRSRTLSLYPFGPKMIRGILPLPTSLSTLFPFTHFLTRPGGGTLHFSWLHQLSPATSCHRTGGSDYPKGSPPRRFKGIGRRHLASHLILPIGRRAFMFFLLDSLFLSQYNELKT